MLTDLAVIKTGMEPERSDYMLREGGTGADEPHELGLMMSQLVFYHKVYL